MNRLSPLASSHSAARSALHPLWLSLSALGLVAACSGGAQVKADAKTGAEADGQLEVHDFDEPMSKSAQGSRPVDAQEKKTQAALSQQGAASTRSKERPLLGARHDLRVEPSVTQASCQCLAVVVGGVAAPGLQWGGPQPALDPQSQLAFALGSEGLSCPGAKEGQVASYRGYSVDGDDVVVSVELGQSGRPVTHGAILPKPTGAGRVLIRPGAGVPFGRALGGKGACVLPLR